MAGSKEKRIPAETATLVARLATTTDARFAKLEAMVVALRRDQAVLLNELRARGLQHLPAPEGPGAIRLSDEARLTRQRKRAEHARLHSKGRTKGGKKAAKR